MPPPTHAPTPLPPGHTYRPTASPTPTQGPTPLPPGHTYIPTSAPTRPLPTTSPTPLPPGRTFSPTLIPTQGVVCPTEGTLVSVSYVVRNLDYESQQRNAEIRDDFKAVARQRVANEVGFGVIPDCVTVVLSVGSVKVDAFFRIPQAVTLQAVQAKFSTADASLQASLEAAVQEIPNIGNVASGNVTVSETGATVLTSEGFMPLAEVCHGTRWIDAAESNCTLVMVKGSSCVASCSVSGTAVGSFQCLDSLMRGKSHCLASSTDATLHQVRKLGGELALAIPNVVGEQALYEALALSVGLSSEELARFVVVPVSNAPTPSPTAGARRVLQAATCEPTHLVVYEFVLPDHGDWAAFLRRMENVPVTGSRPYTTFSDYLLAAAGDGTNNELCVRHVKPPILYTDVAARKADRKLLLPAVAITRSTTTPDPEASAVPVVFAQDGVSAAAAFLGVVCVLLVILCVVCMPVLAYIGRVRVRRIHRLRMLEHQLEQERIKAEEALRFRALQEKLAQGAANLHDEQDLESGQQKPDKRTTNGASGESADAKAEAKSHGKPKAKAKQKKRDDKRRDRWTLQEDVDGLMEQPRQSTSQGLFGESGAYCDYGIFTVAEEFEHKPEYCPQVALMEGDPLCKTPLQTPANTPLPTPSGHARATWSTVCFSPSRGADLLCYPTERVESEEFQTFRDFVKVAVSTDDPAFLLGRTEYPAAVPQRVISFEDSNVWQQENWHEESVGSFAREYDQDGIAAGSSTEMACGNGIEHEELISPDAGTAGSPSRQMENGDIRVHEEHVWPSPAAGGSSSSERPASFNARANGQHVSPGATAATSSQDEIGDCGTREDGERASPHVTADLSSPRPLSGAGTAEYGEHLSPDVVADGIRPRPPPIAIADAGGE